MGSILAEFAGFHREAEVFFRKAFILDNDSGLYYLNLAYNERNQNNAQKALRYFKLATRLDSQRIFSIQRLGEQYMRVGNIDSALIWFRKVIEHFEETGNIEQGILHRIAYTYSQIGDTAKADYWFKTAIEMNQVTIKKQNNSHSRQKESVESNILSC
jgi:tetratricopeptide (TPR) repeat protein